MAVITTIVLVTIIALTTTLMGITTANMWSAAIMEETVLVMEMLTAV